MPTPDVYSGVYVYESIAPDYVPRNEGPSVLKLCGYFLDPVNISRHHTHTHTHSFFATTLVPDQKLLGYLISRHSDTRLR